MRPHPNSGGQTLLHVWRTGSRYASQNAPALGEWTNLKHAVLAEAPGAWYDARDVRQGLPFADESFDAACATRIVEHLTPDEQRQLLRELHRVLRPGGVLRVTTPDLETACREYLLRLGEALEEPSEQRLIRYEWACFLLLDQLARDRSGGRMRRALDAGRYVPDHVRALYGLAFEEFASAKAEVRPLLDRLREVGPRGALRAAWGRIQRHWYRHDPARTGELDKWRHDRISLRTLLEESGFTDARTRRFDESSIPGWERYRLDGSDQGGPIEVSLHMEATRA